MHLRCGRRYTEVMAARVRQLTVFLVIGAVINVVLAMGFIWFDWVEQDQGPGYSYNNTRFDRMDSLGLTRLSWAGLDGEGLFFEPGSLPSWSGLRQVRPPYLTGEQFRAQPVKIVYREFGAGWPLRALVFEYGLHLSGPHKGQDFILSGIELPARKLPHTVSLEDQHRAIPLRITPTGFALNTLLFSSVAAAVWHGSLAARRYRRRSRGRCEGCGYPRVGLAPDLRCPECGAHASEVRKTVH
jgi:hypothetical protein